jgi:tetratricopeptide (TPR) repeat protein
LLPVAWRLGPTRLFLPPLPIPVGVRWPPTIGADENDLGAVRQLLKQWPVAIEAYSRGLERDPNNVVLLTNRAWAYVFTSQPDKARADFAEAARLAPRSAEVHTGLGYLLAGAGADSHTAAQREALLALRHAGGDHKVFHNAAGIYVRLSQTEKAREQEYQDLAVTLLQQSVELWREQKRGPSAIELIKRDDAFPPAFKARVLKLVEEEKP